MIFITGANGYVGKNLLPQLLKSNPDEFIFGLVRKRPKYELERVNWIVGDLFSYSTYAPYVGQSDTVIHLAGCISPLNIRDFFQVNVLGTRRLLFAARAQGHPRIIYLSSYDAICNQESAYGQSKKMAEQEIFNSTLRYTIVRPTVIYGGQGRSGLFPLLRMIKRQHFIPIVGTGRQLLQPVHVRDLCQTMIRVVNQVDNYPQEFINIGGPEKLNWLELVTHLGRRESVSPVAIPIPVRLLLFALKPLAFLDRYKILAEKFASVSRDKVIDYECYKETQDFISLSQWSKMTKKNNE